jgi:hypothetical protein
LLPKRSNGVQLCWLRRWLDYVDFRFKPNLGHHQIRNQTVLFRLFDYAQGALTIASVGDKPAGLAAPERAGYPHALPSIQPQVE